VQHHYVAIFALVKSITARDEIITVSWMDQRLEVTKWPLPEICISFYEWLWKMFRPKT